MIFHNAWLLQSRRQCSEPGGYHEGIGLFVCYQLCKLAYAGEVVGRLNGLMIDKGEVVIDVSVHNFIKNLGPYVWNRSTALQPVRIY